MNADGIVKGFDVFEHAEASVFEIVEVLMVGPLVFEGPEEPFGDSVVVAAASAAHRAVDAQSMECLLIGVAGVLTAAVGVVQESASVGSARLDGLAEGLGDQLRGEGSAQRPTHDLAAEQIEHHSQINQPSAVAR